MKNMRTSLAAKAIAVCLAILVGAGAFWATIVTVGNWDDLWLGDNSFYESGLVSSGLYDYTSYLDQLTEIYDSERQTGTLSYLDQQRRTNLLGMLKPEATNFRFQLHAQDGSLIYSNLEGGSGLAEQVYRVEIKTIHNRSSNAVDNDNQLWNGAANCFELVLLVDGVYQTFSPTVPEQVQLAQSYGWFYNGNAWSYYEGQDSRIVTAEYVLEYGLAEPLVVQDSFWESRMEFSTFQRWLPLVAVLAPLLDLAGLALLVYLCSAAGHTQAAEQLRPNWQDRIPFDLYLCIQAFALSVLIAGGDEITWRMSHGLTTETLIGIGVISVGISGCLVAGLLTLATRLKLHTIVQNTLIWRFCAWIGRGIRSLFRSWSMSRRFCLMFLLYLLGTALTTATIILIPFYQGFVLYAILRWMRQWKQIRQGVAHIIGGDPDYRIQTDKLYPDLKEHAEQLNDLGQAIGNAVEERLKSERFKAELITNVSHDLKTPLTSIISYVDLIKKEQVENPKIWEYIEVLDRKSQRLKKLTEDLVEASKASTGNLSVQKERLGIIQLIQQALGEYEEKFEQRRLKLIPTLHPTELYIMADGRHMWRIIDNLLSNCFKYAMEGTRVYLDVVRWDDTVTLSVKNVSRQQLNIPAEQLMERFVRGEESRSTEGSGLGLSIARSLIELQGGAFRLSIDGDLFKAVVSFPEAPIEIPPKPMLGLEDTSGAN